MEGWRFVVGRHCELKLVVGMVVVEPGMVVLKARAT